MRAMRRRPVVAISFQVQFMTKRGAVKVEEIDLGGRPALVPSRFFVLPREGKCRK